MQSSIRKYSFYINHTISLIIIDFDRSVADQEEDELDPKFSFTLNIFTTIIIIILNSQLTIHTLSSSITIDFDGSERRRAKIRKTFFHGARKNNEERRMRQKG